MPHLVRFLIRHALIGFCLAVVFVAGLLAFDIASLRSLVMTSSSGGIGVAALTVALCLTFGSLQMGFAVMLLGENSDRDGGRRFPLVPVRVPVRVRRNARY